MKHPKLLFVDYPDKSLGHIEYMALVKLYLRPNKLTIEDDYPEIENRCGYWSDAFFAVQKKDSNDWRVKLYVQVVNTAKTFEEAQDMIRAEVRVDHKQSGGEGFKSKKKIGVQSAFQQERLGDDYIMNNDLVSAAKYACVQLASDWAEISEVEQVAAKLEAQHCEEPLTDGERHTLLNEIMLPFIEKLKTPSLVESKILESGDKKLYFLWGRIKQHCPISGEIDLAQSQVIKLASVSARDALDLVNDLVKLGALELVRKPKKGSLTGKGGKYRRLV